MDLAIAHKNLWAWLTEDPLREKYSWPGLQEFDSVKNECFACEHADRVGNGRDDDICDFCPLTEGAKKILGVSYCKRDCLGGLYTQYLSAVSDYRFAKEMEVGEDTIGELKQKAVKLTETIRDLEWKD